ncbi:MAG: PAS domain S-box protein [Leptospiraceae bacterium]|nr:PAS domain S-box protein [Leptospiraceae bacterium]
MLSHIVEHFPFPILLVSKSGEIVYSNLFSSNLFGYESQELLGKKFIEFTSPDYQNVDSSIFADFKSNKTFITTSEKKIIHKLGQEVWVKQTVVPIKFDSEDYNYLLFVMENISFQKAKQEFISDKEELFNSFFHNNNAVKFLIDPADGSIVEANQAACDFYGYTKEEFTKMKIFEINAMTREQIKFEMEKAEQRKQTSFHFPHRLANGEIRIVEVHSGPIQLKNKNYLLSIIHDITNQYHLIEESSTKTESNILLNRIKLIQAINNLLISNSLNLSHAFIWIDVDHFSHTKAKYPSEVSKQIVLEIIQRIKSQFSTHVYQLAEDEFGILIETKHEINHLLNLVKQLFNIFQLPFQVQNTVIPLTASFGICMILNRALEAKRIFELGSSALLEAKLKGRNTFFIYNSNLDTNIKLHLNLEKLLISELEQNEFELQFQPILDKSNILHGVKCQLRWKNPKLVSLSSYELNDILLNYEIFQIYYKNFLIKITSQIQEWSRENYKIGKVFLPILKKEFFDSKYIDILSSIISKQNIPPNVFVLDLKFILSENEKQIITELKKLGFQISFHLNDCSLSFLESIATWNIDYALLNLANQTLENKQKLRLLKFLFEIFQDFRIKLICEGFQTLEEYESATNLGLEILTSEFLEPWYLETHFIIECLAKGYHFYD